MSSLFRRGDGRISFEEFSLAVTSNGFPEPSHATYWAFLNSARNALLFDKQELSMVLAHMIHESKGFVERREQVDLKNYPEDYKDAGCDLPGQLYYGRGYLKIAHCKNYRDISVDMFRDDRLVKDPECVAQNEDISMGTAFSFWKRTVQGVPGVAEGQFGRTTNAITGGLECFGPNHILGEKRFEIYKNVRKAFKLKGEGDATGCYELDKFINASKSF